MAIGTSGLQEPAAFRRPGRAQFREALSPAPQEKTRYYDELAELTDDQRNMRTVTPGYVEGMTSRWIALYHGEIAAAQYMGVAAHNVLLTEYWDFIACCVCQQIDELQHSEMDRDMLFRAGCRRQAAACWEAVRARG